MDTKDEAKRSHVSAANHSIMPRPYRHRLLNSVIDLLPIFTREKIYFLTLKSAKPRYQKMDTLRKMLMKISKNFIITRESNKATPGYHFHALFRTAGYPKKSWFKKGVHIHLKELKTNREFKKYESIPVFPAPVLLKPTLREIAECPDPVLEQDLIVLRTRELEREFFKKAIFEDSQAEKAISVLKYIGKELTPLSSYYKDFIIVIRGKHRYTRLDDNTI